MNYIKEFQVNLLDGILNGVIYFQEGFNILSGENGTLKTKLLKKIKEKLHEQHRIQAISPKRNMERRSNEQIIQHLRQQGRNLELFQRESASWQINDQSFSNYPTFAELYYLIYEQRCKDGEDRRSHMQAVCTEFNDIIKQIFDCYILEAIWDSNSGSPQLKMLKYGKHSILVEELSLGEQEILSLVLNLYASRNSYDIFLIDEPEIHLNWHLEECLFKYMDDFCHQYKKQIIIVTHSRAIFNSSFLKKSQFLFWNNEGNIEWHKEPNKEQLKRIAGEAINIINLGDFSTPTFFVEDEAHRKIIEKLASVLNGKVNVTKCGNSSNVKSLYQFSKTQGGWSNSVFIRDGDNQNSPFPGQEEFIHLDKYCIENYLLDIEHASYITDKNQKEIKELLLQAIKENREKILKNNKFFDFLIDGLNIDDLTSERLSKLDASEILKKFIKKLGMSYDTYLSLYIEKSFSRSNLNSLFPEKIINHIVSSRIIKEVVD